MCCVHFCYSTSFALWGHSHVCLCDFHCTILESSRCGQGGRFCVSFCSNTLPSTLPALGDFLPKLFHTYWTCALSFSQSYFLCIEHTNLFSFSPRYFLCIKWASSSLCRCHAGFQCVSTWFSSHSQVLHTCHLSPEHSVSSHSWLWVSPVPQAPVWNACPPRTVSCFAMYKGTFSLVLTLFLR